jgi:hypothetical protein
MAVTGQFSEHLAPGLREIIGTRLGGRESYYSQVTKVQTSARNYEDYLAAAGLPIATLKPEGDDIVAYDPLEGSKMRITHEVYGIGFEISEEAMDDDLYKGSGSALTEAGNGLADSLAEVVEIQAHRLFNSEAFLTSAVPTFMRTLPDNASTISIYNSTGHNPVSGGEAGAQANRPSTDVDLTVTSFRAALTTFKKYRNDRNLRIPGISQPNRMVVPPDLEWDAKEILGSSNRPDTANRVENVTKGAVSLLVNPYLDDTDAWFLLAPVNWLLTIWRQRPRMDSFDDRRARVAVFVGYERFTRAAIHWLGTYATSGG